MTEGGLEIGGVAIFEGSTSVTFIDVKYQALGY